MNGKIALVTGATFGIGRETALGLAHQGAQVVIVGRSEARTRTTVEYIKRESGKAHVDSLVADLSSVAEVQRLAMAFKARYRRLDVLVNNAGAIFTERQMTPEGFERTWALNHLAYFALTLALLDLLKASAPSRVVNVSSAMHLRGQMDFDNTQGERKFSGSDLYAQSKLANVLFTNALARRLEGTGVTANCLHPGVVATGFAHNNTGPIKWLATLAKPFLISADKGAATSMYLATSPEVEGVTGKYFAKCKEAKSSRSARDEATQERLWALSEAQVAQATHGA